jgi:hypothetical protein
MRRADADKLLCRRIAGLIGVNDPQNRPVDANRRFGELFERLCNSSLRFLNPAGCRGSYKEIRTFPWSTVIMNMKLAIASLVSAVFCASASAADMTYRKDIRPLVKAQCEDCHGAQSPSLEEFQLDQQKYTKEKSGPRFDSYGDLIALVGWPDSGALMRRLDDGANTPDKKPGNMYNFLGETDAERKTNLAKIKAWVGEDAWNLQRWKKRGDVPAITKEELDKLKLNY